MIDQSLIVVFIFIIRFSGSWICVKGTEQNMVRSSFLCFLIRPNFIPGLARCWPTKLSSSASTLLSSLSSSMSSTKSEIWKWLNQNKLEKKKTFRTEKNLEKIRIRCQNKILWQFSDLAKKEKKNTKGKNLLFPEFEKNQLRLCFLAIFRNPQWRKCKKAALQLCPFRQEKLSTIWHCCSLSEV